MSTLTMFLSSVIANANVSTIDLPKLNSLVSPEIARETDSGTGTCIVDTEKILNTSAKYQQIQILLNDTSEAERNLLKKVLLEELLNEINQKN